MSRFTKEIPNISEIFYNKDRSIYDTKGDFKFHAQDNYSNLLIINLEEEDSEGSINLINFTPKNANRTYTTHWFYLDPIKKNRVYKRPEDNKPKVFQSYIIEVPNLVLQNNNRDKDIINTITVVRRYGFNDLGLFNSLNELVNNHTPNKELADSNAFAYVLEYENDNYGFYQVIQDIETNDYIWTKRDNVMNFGLRQKQYHTKDIITLKGFSNIGNIPNVEGTTTQALMNAINQSKNELTNLKQEVEDFEITSEETDTLLTQILKTNYAYFTISGEVKIDNNNNALLEKSSEGLYVKHDDTKVDQDEYENEIEDIRNTFATQDFVINYTLPTQEIIDRDNNILTQAKEYIEGKLEEQELSNYYNKEEVDLIKDNLEAEFDNYYDISEIDDLLDLKVDVEDYEEYQNVLDGRFDSVNDNFENYTPITREIVGLALENDITENDIRQALEVATLQSKGLMSRTDKEKLENIWAVFDNGDNDDFVDTINEILTIFEGYPEALNLFEVLSGKVNANDDIVANTKTKISYDSKGLVVGGENLTPSDIPNLNTSKITSGRLTKERQHIDTVYDDDSRLSDARTPKPHTHDIGDVNGLENTLNKKLESEDIIGSVNNVLYEKETHKLTFERYDAVDIVVDFPIEALIENISLDGNDLVLTYEDGTTTSVPLNTLLVGVVKEVNGKTPNSSGVINLNYSDLNNLPNLFSGDYNDLTNKPSIPSKTSDLTNDSDFTTKTYVDNEIANVDIDLSDYVINEDIKEVVNGVSYNTTNHKITFSRYNDSDIVIDLPIENLLVGLSLDGDDLVLELEDGTTQRVALNALLVGVVKKVNGQTPNSSGEVNLNYNQITGLENVLSTKADKEELPTKVSELENDAGYLTTHQSLSDYAKKSELFSKNYNDLTNKPTIPSKTSDLTNDSGYATETYVDNAVSALETSKQDKLVAGDNITIENNVISASGGGGEVDLNEMAYFNYAGSIYGSKYSLLANAWEDMKEVDGTEIERNSTSSIQFGRLQYPNGEDNGVIIPNSVTSIGNSAFDSWTSNNQPLVIPNSVTSIGNYAFRDWTSNNQPLVIPDSVTSIGVGAFDSWTSNNQPLVIPDSVTSIGNYAFRGWTSNNQPLVIPNSVTSIGNGAFEDWTSNNQPLVIPNSVTSIGSYAFIFWEANNQPLVIPNSVTSIGNFAFSGWSLVPYVEIQAITPPTLSNATAFNNQNDAPIYVPDESVDAYKTATNWNVHASRIFPISDK